MLAVITALLGWMRTEAAESQDTFNDTIDKTGEAQGLDVANTKESGVIVLPIPIVDPTIGNGLALAALFPYRLNRADTNSPPSSTLVAGGLTDSESVFAAMVQKFFFNEDRYRFEGLAGFGDFNLKFFGVGADSVFQNNPLDYNIEGLFLELKALARVSTAGLYLGAIYTLLDTEASFKTGFPPVPRIELDSATGGLGPLLTFDTRDNKFTPTTGAFLEANAKFYGSAFGGDFDYEKAEVTTRHYFSLLDNLVSATRLKLSASDGDIPFYDLPSVESRGFPRTKFQDRHVWQVETALRWNFYKEWGAVAFVSVAQAARSFSDYGNQPLINAGGVGLRYRVSDEFKINIAFDVAFGEDESAFYFRIGEAF